MKKITMIITMVTITTIVNAQTWTIIPSGTTNTLNSVSFGTSSSVFVTGINKTLLKSIDGGLTFLPVTGFATGNEDFSSCHFNNSDTGYVAGGDFTSFPTAGFIYRTVNGGSSWTQVISGLSSAFNDITFPSSQYGYAVGGEAGTGIVYKSNNYGLTWTSVYSSGMSANLLTSAYFVNNTDGYVAGNDESAFESKLINVTGGSVSSNINFPAYTLFTDVYFKTIDTGFVTSYGASNFILKTTDQGVTWSPVYTGVALKSITFSDNQTGWAVGDGGVILKSIDGGDTWTSVISPVTDNLSSIIFTNQNLGIIVGENGRVLRWNIATTGIKESQSIDESLIIYPNPNKGVFILQSQANNLQKTGIEITNIGGQIIYKTELIELQTTIDISKQPKGIYFVKIAGNNGNITSKKIIIE